MAGDRGFFTPNEVAKLLMVSPITVRQWATKGALRAELTLGGHRRFLREEVERFARQHGMTLKLPGHAGATRVLFVDDDRAFVGYLTELLSGHPEFETETAFDGFDAGGKVHAFKPDVVVIDLMMPDLDGFEVCRRIKDDPHTASIRVIAMTGYPSPENRERALAAGAAACLAKPIDAAKLMRLLRRPASAAGASP